MEQRESFQKEGAGCAAGDAAKDEMILSNAGESMLIPA